MTLAPLHYRMLVIIPPEAFARWLDTADYGPAEVRDLPASALAGYLVAHAMPHVQPVTRCRLAPWCY